MSRLMLTVLVHWQSFLATRKGVAAIEYGLIAALIAVAIIGVVSTVGTRLTSSFNRIAMNLS